MRQTCVLSLASRENVACRGLVHRRASRRGTQRQVCTERQYRCLIFISREIVRTRTFNKRPTIDRRFRCRDLRACVRTARDAYAPISMCDR